MMSKFKTEPTKVVLSLSGGLDSSCLALYYLAKGKSLKTYSFSYGQKHSIELEKVKKNVAFLQSKGLPIEHQIIDLKDVFSDNSSSLVASTGKDIPQGSYKAETMASTVIPVRNCIFTSIIFAKAINWAVKSNDNVIISLGVHGGDHFVYLDCRPESVEAMRHALTISDTNSDKVDYEAPFVNIDKTGVLTAGLKAMNALGFTDKERNDFLENTHTCYDPDYEGRACGKCGSCVERQLSFYENGFEDPAPYSFRYTYDELKELVKN